MTFELIRKPIRSRARRKRRSLVHRPDNVQTERAKLEFCLTSTANYFFSVFLSVFLFLSSFSIFSSSLFPLKIWRLLFAYFSCAAFWSWPNIVEYCWMNRYMLILIYDINICILIFIVYYAPKFLLAYIYPPLFYFIIFFLGKNHFGTYSVFNLYNLYNENTCLCVCVCIC